MASDVVLSGALCEICMYALLVDNTVLGSRDLTSFYSIYTCVCSSESLSLLLNKASKVPDA